MTFRASFLPSSSKPLPFSHHLCCFLDLHILLTLNYLHPKPRFLPMPLRKALAPFWGFAAFPPPKMHFPVFKFLSAPLFTVHCCV